MHPLPTSTSSSETRQKKMQTTTLPHENNAKGGKKKKKKVFNHRSTRANHFPCFWRTAFFSGGSAKMLGAFVQTVSSCAHTSSLSSGLKRVLPERHCVWANVRVNTPRVYLLPLDVHSRVPAGPRSPPVVPPGGLHASSSPCTLSTGAFGKETELCSPRES